MYLQPNSKYTKESKAEFHFLVIRGLIHFFHISCCCVNVSLDITFLIFRFSINVITTSLL